MKKKIEKVSVASTPKIAAKGAWIPRAFHSVSTSLSPFVFFALMVVLGDAFSFRDHWAWGFFFGVVLFSYFSVLPAYGWAAAALVAYLGFSVTHFNLRLVTGYAFQNQDAQVMMDAISLHSVLIVLGSAAIAFYLSRTIMFRLAVVLFGLFISLSVILKWLTDSENLSIILFNQSMEACLIAACTPFLLKFLRVVKFEKPLDYGLTALPVLAVLTLDSSVGFVALAIAFISDQLFKHNFTLFSFRRAASVLGFVSMIGVAAVFLFFDPREFLNSNGRYDIWENSMRVWATHFNQLIGAGWSGFFHFGQEIQNQLNIDPASRWVWLHNDWLQMIFDFGFIGFALTAAVFVQSLVCAVKNDDTDLFNSLLVFGFVSLFNMPSRYVAFGVIGLCLIFQALRRQITTGDIHAIIHDIRRILSSDGLDRNQHANAAAEIKKYTNAYEDKPDVPFETLSKWEQDELKQSIEADFDRAYERDTRK